MAYRKRRLYRNQILSLVWSWIMSQCCQNNCNNKTELEQAVADIEELIKRYVIYPAFRTDALAKVERLRELLELNNEGCQCHP